MCKVDRVLMSSRHRARRGVRSRKADRRGPTTEALSAVLIPFGLVLVLVGAVVADPPPLIEAAKEGDWEAVRSLLEQGAEVTATAPDGATALHWASYWDDVETAELLIRAGADVNAANDLGAAPLWVASLNGSSSMVRTLLEAGADPNAALLSGEVPVMTAARTGNPEVVERLLAAGADPNARAVRAQTALMWAASQRHSDAVGVPARIRSGRPRPLGGVESGHGGPTP